MDKIFSARLDEAVIRRISDLARRLDTSKKAVVERAILVLAETVEADEGVDVFERTLGAWKRTEEPAETAAEARRAFEASMHRQHS